MSELDRLKPKLSVAYIWSYIAAYSLEFFIWICVLIHGGGTEAARALYQPWSWVHCKSLLPWRESPTLETSDVCCSQAMDSMTAWQQTISAHVRMTEVGMYDSCHSCPWTLFHLLPFCSGANQKNIEFKGDIDKQLSYYSTVLMTLALCHLCLF